MRISDWSSDVCSSDLKKPHLRLKTCQFIGGNMYRGVAATGGAPPSGPATSDSGRGDTRLNMRECRLRRLTMSRMSQSIARSEEHTSELQYLMRISYAVFCLKKK